MNQDDLDKLIDNGLIRLNAKAAKQRQDNKIKALLLPSLNAVLALLVITVLLLVFSWYFYILDVKAPLFFLGNFSYYLLLFYFVISVFINFNRDVATNSLLILIAYYLVGAAFGCYLHEKFMGFVLSSGYKIVMPF